MVFGIKRKAKKTSDTWREEERKGLQRMPDEPTQSSTWREDNPKSDKSDTWKEDNPDTWEDDKKDKFEL